MKKVCVVFAVVVVVALVLGEVSFFKAEAVTCSPTELSSCGGAIFSGTPPSSTCCQKLREQKPCLCGYIKNPSLQPFVNSPGAKKVAGTCGVPFPKC